MHILVYYDLGLGSFFWTNNFEKSIYELNIKYNENQ